MDNNQSQFDPGKMQANNTKIILVTTIAGIAGSFIGSRLGSTEAGAVISAAIGAGVTYWVQKKFLSAGPAGKNSTGQKPPAA